MHRILESFKGSRRFVVLFVLVLLFPITNPCDAIGVFLGLDNNEAPCNTFAFTNVSGLPWGPVFASWNPVQGITGYRISVWGGGDVIGYADAAGNATSVNIPLNQNGVTNALKAGGLMSVFGVAYTGVADPPLCEAVKNFTFTVSPMSKKSTLAPTANVCQPAAPGLPCNCNGFCDPGESYYTCPQDCPFAPIPPAGGGGAGVCIAVRGDCSAGGTCCSGLSCKPVGNSKRCEP